MISNTLFFNKTKTPLCKVAILLCTYQGQDFLTEQLQSFEVQSHSSWEVWASDDGSHDGTLAILELYKNNWPEGSLNILAGPARGYVANFLSLTSNEKIQADYFAYSDQDDIWNADKIERAVNWLNTIPSNIAALYCSRTCVVDSNNNEIGLTPLFSKCPSFANALIQNIGGGNTMIFNQAARKLISNSTENFSVVCHDWWAYMVVSGCGGEVFYDSIPTIRYRQHNENLVGMNSGWKARLKCIRMLWQGQFRIWNDINTTALRKLNDNLTPQNREILNSFSQAREMSFVPRLIFLKRCGIYRQTLLGNLGLMVAALLKKI